MLDIVATFGPPRAAFYRIKSGSSPATADVLIMVLWSGDSVEAFMDDPAATRPLVTTLLSDFPVATVGYVAGIAV